MKTQTFIIITLTVLFNVMALQGFSAEKQAPETDHKALSFLPEMSNLVLEEKLELAPWMFSDLQWQKEPEERMEIAPWMTNDQAWKLKEKQMMVQEPVNFEEHLAIESWMTDDQLWHL
jgi:hypothetical protein